VVGLAAYAGKTFRLRFRLTAPDCNGTAYGPAIDDLQVLDLTCKSNADCDDGQQCTTDTCILATGVCKNGATGGGTGRGLRRARDRYRLRTSPERARPRPLSIGGKPCWRGALAGSVGRLASRTIGPGPEGMRP